MQEISQNEMKGIQGGAVNWSIVAGVSALVSFIAGVIDGFMNPIKCRN